MQHARDVLDRHQHVHPTADYPRLCLTARLLLVHGCRLKSELQHLGRQAEEQRHAGTAAVEQLRQSAQASEKALQQQLQALSSELAVAKVRHAPMLRELLIWMPPAAAPAALLLKSQARAVVVVATVLPSLVACKPRRAALHFAPVPALLVTCPASELISQLRSTVVDIRAPGTNCLTGPRVHALDRRHEPCSLARRGWHGPRPQTRHAMLLCALQAAAASAEQRAGGLEAALQQNSSATVSMTSHMAQTLADSAGQVAGPHQSHSRPVWHGVVPYAGSCSGQQRPALSAADL
jgi:hypothetical protein